MRMALRSLLFLALVWAVVAPNLAAFAQTYEPQYNQQQNNGQLGPSGSGTQTQNTVPNPYIDAHGFVPIVNDSAQVNVQGGSYNGGSTRGIQRNVNDILKRDNPYGQAEQSSIQPRVFVEKDYSQNAPSGLLDQQMQALGQQNQMFGQQYSSLATQAGEQGSNAPQSSVSGLLNQGLGSINDTYRGIHQFFNDDIIGNLFSQIGQLIGKWISELVNGWIADTVQFLASFLRVFVLNPNIAVNGLNGSQSDGISPYIRQGADVMYGIAVDLLLLLFILAIWKYWAEASWRGGGNLMGAVGRLIFTAGLMLAFPTLYAFEIQISNEMIKAIYFNSSDQVMMLDAALASAVKGGILAGVGGLTSAFAPLLGSVTLGFVGATVGQIFAFAGLVIFMILGGILIAELIYLLVLKAIQTALLTAQYMFAPIFLVFFATPDTENICSGFIKAWVETSLWTFVWVGLLKILVIIMFSDYNPWGKILMAVGVLQMMLQVPTFLARAQISPMSDFLSAGLIFGGLMKMFGAIGNGANMLFNRAMNKKIADHMGKNQQNMSETTNTPVGTPDQSRNFSTLGAAGRGDPDAIAKLNAMKNKQNPNGTGPNGAVPPGTTGPGVTPPGAGPGSGTGATPPSRTGAGSGTGAGTGTGTGATTTPNPNLNTLAANQANQQQANRQQQGQQQQTAQQQAQQQQAHQNQQGVPPGFVRTAAGLLVPAGIAAAAGAGLAAGGARNAGTAGAGGGTGGAAPPAPPVIEEPDKAKWEEARLSTRYYSNDGLYGVDAVRGIVASIKTLGTRVREGQKANSVEGTSRGGASFINLREGASDGEKARTLMVAGLANRMLDDPGGADAARAAAVRADAGGPKGLMENMMANYMEAQGQDWRSSPIGKQRLERAQYQQAVKGAEAYLNQQPGNAYTKYLEGRYGKWDANKDAMAVWIATDPEASESAWNPAIGPATDALQASGLAITPATRGAIQNPYVMTMRPGARKAAVRALLRASMNDSRMEGMDANTTEGAILLGEIARSMPEAFVQTAIAIDGVSGGKDLGADTLNAHANLSSELGLPADATYRATSSGVGTVAANITGVAGMRGARSFEQVRRIAYATFGAEEGQRQFETVLVASADRVRMMNTAGISTRMMIDQGFANQADSFIENFAGGYVNIDDPNMAAQRDNLQTAIQAAGITVRHLGTAGFTPGRANAVYRWIQDGNNPNQLSGQDIIVTERLIGSQGVSRVSQSMVQVLRQLDGGGSGALSPDTVQVVQDIANHVDTGNARADQAIAVRNVMGSGYQVNRQTVEIAARLQHSAGGFDPQVFRVEADLIQNDVVRSGSDAHTVLSHAVRNAASERGIATNLPLNQIMSELESRGCDSQWIEDRIMTIQRQGGFDSRQLVQPTVFDVAYQAASDFSSNAHRVQSIQIAERIHGTQALGDESVMQVYDNVLEAGVNPQDMNLQRFYAARALQEAQQVFQAPPGGNAPPTNVKVLDKIRSDSRFRMDSASLRNPPRMDQTVWDDICRMRW